MTNPTIEQTTEDIQFYFTEEGVVPVWDHPHMFGYRKLPQKYYPYTTIEQILNATRRRQIEVEDIRVLKVLGDAVATNEDQLRRYLRSIMSRSEVSKRLDLLRRNSFVDRWHVRVDEDEDVRPPAPFTLGIAGYKYMNHLYGEQAFMNPNTWDNHNTKTVQRYVAMNEFRCRLVEAKCLKDWKWNPVVANHQRYKRPFGVAEVNSGEGVFNFIIERAQQSQNFIGFLNDKLHQWKAIFEENGDTFPIRKMSKNLPIFVIYCSTRSIADTIQKELMLDTFPFTVWVAIEEYFETKGFAKSFLIPKPDKLQGIEVPFLSSKIISE